MPRKTWAAAVAVAALMTVAACSSSGDGSTTGGTSANRALASSGQADGSGQEPSEDIVTPMIVTSLGDPIPVRGADDQFHVAYELQVINASPRTMNITGVDTVSEGGETLSSLGQEEVQERTVILGAMPLQPPAVKSVGPGQVGILVLDDIYPSRDAVPERFTHRISATFDPPAPGLHPFASQFPSEITQETSQISVGSGEPIVLGAPFRGANWVAVNGCCTLSGHRAAILPLNGQLNATERYAIDWVQLNPAMQADPASIPEGQMPTFDGDPTANDSYLAYDADLLAVADGKVVAMSDGMPDSTPQHLPEGLSVHQLGGNYLIIDIGNGFYAFYGHVKAGSFTVEVGDEVKKGDVVGLLGNTGNSSEAHLHFHVSRGPTPLASTQWPYLFESFELAGTLGDGFQIADEPASGPRTDEMPLALNVVSFPE